MRVKLLESLPGNLKNKLENQGVVKLRCLAAVFYQNHTLRGKTVTTNPYV